jgi:hypothetical protein
MKSDTFVPQKNKSGDGDVDESMTTVFRETSLSFLQTLQLTSQAKTFDATVLVSSLRVQTSNPELREEKAGEKDTRNDRE